MFNFKFYTTYSPVGQILETDFSNEALEAVTSLESNGAYCPRISRVFSSKKTTTKVPVKDDNGNTVLAKDGQPKLKTVNLDVPVYTTVVEFADGTKSIVKCSSHDGPDVETAIVNAIVKRVFGTVVPVDRNGHVSYEMSGNGLSTRLKKLAQSAQDPHETDAIASKARREARAAHEARQAKEHQQAHERRINKLAKEMTNYVEALKKAGFIVKPIVLDKQPNENHASCCSVKPPCSCNKPKAAYVRPNKKFADFSQEEKREYWNAQKRGLLKR